MSVNDLIIKEALAAQKIYEDWERSVGGPHMVEALQLQQQIEEAAAPYSDLNLVTNKLAPPLSAHESLLQEMKRIEAEATDVEALRRALGADNGSFALRELQREAANLHAVDEIVRANRAFENSFTAALRGMSVGLPVESLWRNVSRIAEPWILLDDPYRSFEAFGALSELANVHTAASSDDTVVDPRIDDLPAPAARPLGRAAGLKIHEVEARVNLASPRTNGILLVGTGTWGHEAHVQIQGVEVMLRERLDQHMTGQIGPNWHKHRVSKSVLDTWRSRQAEARVGGSDNVLDFATFGELRDVVLRGDVWPVISAGIGMTKEEFAVLLDHLMEIRHAVDHGRPLLRRHFVWCFADVDRILQAFGFETPDEDLS